MSPSLEIQLLMNRASLAEGNFAATLALLRSLKSGDISLDRVQVQQNGWTLSPEPQMGQQLLDSEPILVNDDTE